MAHGAGNDSSSSEERKRVLRAEMLARRESVSADVAKRVGDRISVALAGDRLFLRAQTVALYAATRGEPDLSDLFDAGVDSGKTMLLPRCRHDRLLAFHSIRDWLELVPGRFGLLEPPDDFPELDADGIDLFIVPCVAVDRSGGRLGRGGGWYDRSLPARRRGVVSVVAAIHAFQLVESVPCSRLDRKVDAIASEQGLVAIQS